MNRLRSRSSFTQYFIPNSMSYTKLPTFIHVYCHYLTINSTKTLAIAETINRVLDIWFRASIPTYTASYVTKKFSKYIDIINKLKKSLTKPKLYAKFDAHIAKYDLLFDICSCQCTNNCRCPIDMQLRDARINVTLQHRRLFPKLSTKRDFVSLINK